MLELCRWIADCLKVAVLGGLVEKRGSYKALQGVLLFYTSICMTKMFLVHLLYYEVQEVVSLLHFRVGYFIKANVKYTKAITR